MAVTASDVKAIATELASVSDATINTWLAIVNRSIYGDTFGTREDDAITFLCAHLVTLSVEANAGQSGSKGAMTSRRVGDVSATFGSAQSKSGMFSDDMLRSTFYGQMYLMLRESSFGDRRV